MPTTYDLHSAEAFTDAVRRMLPVARSVREAAGYGSDPSGLDPSDFLESAFPVLCVALPDLCLDVICRYILTRSGSLPPGLQMMADSAATGGGRLVRGACVAWCGVSILLVDERDDPEEQRFSLMHEGAHFILDYHLPRQAALNKLGPQVRDVLDGRRAPTVGERFHSVLRDTPLQWHMHLYEKNASQRTTAEAHADALACLLLSPSFTPESLVGMSAAEVEDLAASAYLPASVSPAYRAALASLARPPQFWRHPHLTRLGI